MKVLIVDDSTLARKVLRQALLCSGVQESELREAEDGLQALAQLSREPAELLFCDLHMPRLDGRGLLAALERSGHLRQLQVVVLSSQAQQLGAEELQRYGIHRSVRKPVQPEAIQAILAGIQSGGDHD